ncbi:hypothetical protein RND81_13G067200 [Saponaria officinalis]|uniref:GAG-pre-integrase domain-containing protein n=1 Tax=Saponaria officinalis TaxID=3572 RepID=A0AAW1GUQ4_SAPOF
MLRRPKSFGLSFLERYGQPNALELYQLKKDLSNVAQENAPLVEYYSRLKRTWENIDSIDPIPQCTCGAIDLCSCQLLKKLLDRETHSKLIHLLMGLNASYESVKSTILTMEPLPPINKVLGLLQKIERSKQISDAVEVLSEANAYASARFNSGSGGNHSKKARIDDKPVKECSHCHKRGHLREDCFRLKECSYCFGKGHIRDHCFKLRNATAGTGRGKSVSGIQFSRGSNVYKRASNNVDVVPAEPLDLTPLDDPLPASCAADSAPPDMMSDLVTTVVQQCMKAFSENFVAGIPSAHFAGILPSSHAFAVTNSSSRTDWIVDTGASDHMTPHVDLLTDVTTLSKPIFVALPDGHVKVVTKVGRLVLSPHIILTHVLIVPDFQQNLLSVGKLVASSNMVVVFSSTGCQFQDLSSKVTLAVAHKHGDLYRIRQVTPSILQSVAQSSLSADFISASFPSTHRFDNEHCMTVVTASLLHNRLGHTSCDKLKHVCNTPVSINKDFFCEICTLAKHHILPFPRSSSFATSLFDLVHLDVWGPYKFPSMSGSMF